MFDNKVFLKFYENMGLVLVHFDSTSLSNWTLDNRYFCQPGNESLTQRFAVTFYELTQMSTFNDLIKTEPNTQTIDSNSSSTSTEQVQDNQKTQQTEQNNETITSSNSENIFSNNKDDFMSLLSSTPFTQDELSISEQLQQTKLSDEQVTQVTQQTVVKQQVTQQPVVQKSVEKQVFNDSSLGFGDNIETTPPISFGILDDEVRHTSNTLPVKKPFVPARPQDGLSPKTNHMPPMQHQQEKSKMNIPIVHESPFSFKPQNKSTPPMMPQQKSPFVHSDKPPMFIPNEQPHQTIYRQPISTTPPVGSFGNDSVSIPQNGFFKPFVPNKSEHSPYLHEIHNVGRLATNEQQIFKHPLKPEIQTSQEQVFHRPPMFIKHDSSNMQQSEQMFQNQPSFDNHMMQQREYRQPFVINTQMNEVPFSYSGNNDQQYEKQESIQDVNRDYNYISDV